MTATKQGIYQVAKHVLESLDGDWMDWHTEMRDRIKQDDELLAAIIRIGLARLEQDLNHTIRRRAIGNAPSNGTSGETLGSVDGLWTVATATLMDYPLHGGKRLSEATISDVRDEVGHFAMLERESGLRRRWFASIEEHVKDEEKPIGAQFTETELRKLWNQAESA